jgi:predicted GTPase
MLIRFNNQLFETTSLKVSQQQITSQHKTLIRMNTWKIPSSIRIMVFGGSGAGKTSMINVLTNTRNPTHDGATGCTFQSTSVNCNRYGRGYEFIDTAGLNESDYGTVTNQDAVCELVNLLKKSIEGFNLLIYVKERGRITQDDVKNYNLFVNTITGNKIPVIAVVTGCENERNLQNWVEQNKIKFEQSSMKFNAIVGTCFGNTEDGRLKEIFDELRPKSKQYVWEAIDKYASEEPVKFINGIGGIKTIVRNVVNNLCDLAVVYAKIKPAEKLKRASRHLKDTLKTMNFSDEEARLFALEIEGSTSKCNIQ